jgi:hypothetical protein
MKTTRTDRHTNARQLPQLVAISILALTSSSALGNHRFATGTELRLRSQDLSGDARTTATITFKLRLISDGTLCPPTNLECSQKDIWFKTFTLVGSDESTVYLTSIPFPLIAQAEERFKDSVKSADKVLRRSPELSSTGTPTGERALTYTKGATRTPQRPTYHIVWNWDAHYWDISGEHLEDVLALEAALKQQGVNAVWRWR